MATLQVLLIDDDPRLASLLLGPVGLKASRLVRDLAGAVTVDRARHGLVLLNMDLAGSYERCRELRGEPDAVGVPFALFTHASEREALRRLALHRNSAARVEHYLFPPVTAERLSEVLRAAAGEPAAEADPRDSAPTEFELVDLDAPADVPAAEAPETAEPVEETDRGFEGDGAPFDAPNLPPPAEEPKAERSGLEGATPAEGPLETSGRRIAALREQLALGERHLYALRADLDRENEQLRVALSAALDEARRRTTLLTGELDRVRGLQPGTPTVDWAGRAVAEAMSVHEQLAKARADADGYRSEIARLQAQLEQGLRHGGQTGASVVALRGRRSPLGLLAAALAGLVVGGALTLGSFVLAPSAPWGLLSSLVSPKGVVTAPPAPAKPARPVPAPVAPAAAPVADAPAPTSAPAPAEPAAGMPAAAATVAAAPALAPAPAPAEAAADKPAPAASIAAPSAPAASAEPAAVANPADHFVLHTMKEGELVGRVARQYNADPRLTEAYNPEVNFRRLRPGTQIRVPKSNRPWAEVKQLLGL